MGRAINDQVIGQRIEYLRRRHGLTQQQLAARIPCAPNYISMLEHGTRALNSLQMLGRVAAALGVTASELIGPIAIADPVVLAARAAIPALSDALVDCTLDDVPDRMPASIETLLRGVEDMNCLRDRARYDRIAPLIGPVLTDLQVVVAQSTSQAERDTALAGFVEACLTAYEVAKNLGAVDLGAYAARRGHEAALRLGDPTLLGFSSWYMALALLRQNAGRMAASHLVAAIDQMSGWADPSAADTLSAEVLGLLHLTRALQAARDQQPDTARTHLQHAHDLAARTGQRNGLCQHFGPINVAVWTVAIDTELGEGERALALAKEIDVAALDSPNRSAGLWLDAARAATQTRNDQQALVLLDQADSTAPARTRYQPHAQSCLQALVTRAVHRDELIDDLCARFGVTAE